MFTQQIRYKDIMSLQLVYYPDPQLRVESHSVDVAEIASEPNRQLIDGMIETMYDKDGVGLSAIQVGISKRVFVIDVGLGPEVYFNPIITDYIGEAKPMEGEGCLSVPGFYATVQRHMEVKGFAQNRLGHTFSFESLEGTSSQKLSRFHVIQHEYEHLDGEIFLDHLSHVQRDRARSWMKKIKERK